jgi:hypothetical protein
MAEAGAFRIPHFNSNLKFLVIKGHHTRAGVLFFFFSAYNYECPVYLLSAVAIVNCGCGRVRMAVVCFYFFY